jgi:hypothetical protein
MDDGRVLSPRAALAELEHKDDDVYQWAREHPAAFVEPGEEVQVRAGEIYGELPNVGDRDAADPWVVAEASIRGFSVVPTKGGRTLECRRGTGTGRCPGSASTMAWDA